MGNGTREKFMALVDIQRARAIGFTKDFGREDNIAVRRLQSSPFLSNFFDNNMVLSFLLLLLILIGVLFLLHLHLTSIDNIAVLVNVISRDHFCKIFILIVFAIGLICLSHVLDQEIVDFLHYILAQLAEIQRDCETAPA